MGELVVSLSMVFVCLLIYSIITPNEREFHFLWYLAGYFGVADGVILIFQETLIMKSIGVLMVFLMAIYFNFLYSRRKEK